MSKLTKQSDYFKKQADVLLQKTNLLHDLNQYGKVILTGAYAGNVMLNGDIDITVVKDEEYTSEEVLDVLKDLYVKSKFRSYFIKGDWNDKRKGAEFPNGHYIGLKQRLGEEKWTVDIWFVSQAEFESRKKKFFDISNATLTEEQRELILEYKDRRNKENLNISGQEIYEAVLNKDKHI